MPRIEPLRKDNFDTWKLQMKAILRKNKLQGYVDGTIPKVVLKSDGTNKSEATAWETSDGDAQSDIILAIHPSELKQFKNCATARDLWLKLESVYQSSGPARTATLLYNLTKHKMTDNGDMREHVNKFFDTVDKLNEVDVDINPKLLTVLLINSLPASYENFRCAIVSRDALPTPEVMRVKILEESEARKKCLPSAPSNAMIAKKNFHRRERIDKSETEKGGNSSKPSKSRQGGGTTFRCFKCDRVGHKASNCRTFKQSAANADVCLNTFEIDRADTGNRDRAWCLDSGATSHMCSRVEDFSELKKYNRGPLNLANDTSTEIRGSGTARLVVNSNGDKTNVKLSNALHVPDLRTNLVSVSKIADRGLEVHFKKDNAIIVDPEGYTSLCAKRVGDLYYLQEENSGSDIAAAAQKGGASDFVKWHSRLGHVNARDILTAKRDGRIKGIECDDPPHDFNCDVCSKAKMIRTPFPKFSKRQSNLLDLIHTDVCGPMRVESLNRSRYFIEFIDDKSRWCEVRFMRTKAESFETMTQYVALVENQKGCTVKCMQSDNAKEFVSHEFTDYLKNRGIARRLTIPHNPEQNGVAERKNRTLQEMARRLLMGAGLPPSFWAEAVNTANYIRNRSPSKSLNGLTPYEVWTGEVPDLSHFRVFGCKVVYLDRHPGKGKFDSRGKNGIFLGYSEECKGYRIWSVEDKKVLISRDVKFHEGRQTVKALDVIFPDDTPNDDCSRQEKGHHEDYVHIPLKSTKRITEAPAEAFNPDVQHVSTESENESGSDSGSDEHEAHEQQEVSEAPRKGRGRPALGRTGRRGRPRKIYQPPPGEPIQEDEDDQVMLSEVPMKQALSGPDADCWHKAIDAEMISIIKNNTWTLVDRPRNEKVIGSRIVLRNKMNPDGSLEKTKARLVAQGFSQRPGVHFSDTFAPVARLGSIRLMSAVAARSGMIIRQIDVATAYLHGKLGEKIYMEMPKDLAEILERIIEREGESVIEKKAAEMLRKLQEGDKVCLLEKSLYGLKQAGRSWNQTLHEVLIELGAAQSECDPCVYYIGSGEDLIIIIVYVDDILIISKKLSKITRIEKQLANRFEIKVLGEVNYCLGIEFTRSNGHILMQQRGYIIDLLSRFGMNDANSVSTPIDCGLKLTKKTPMTAEDAKIPYRELVGALNYLATATRPDISFAVSYLGQFNNCYGEEQWKAAKRVLRYLKGTVNVGLSYCEGNEPLQGFVDADWGSNVEDRRSFTGYMFLLNGSPISWDAKKQGTVALSTTEAEYMALAESAKESVYLRRFLYEIGLEDAANVSLFCDNNSAIKLAENPTFHARSKHIDIRHHFVRELLKRKELMLRHIPTDKQVADMLTKGLPRPKHEWCMVNSGMSEPSQK